MNLSIKEQAMSFVMIGFGLLFMMYSFYMVAQTEAWYPMVGVVAGMFVAFNQADRNVYRKRVISLQALLVEEGIEYERYNHTRYRTVGDDDESGD